MVDTSYEFLTKFFQGYLPFTPTARQVAEFEGDLTLVSPYLMEASLVEVKNGRLGEQIAQNANFWRPAVFKVYNRKVAEHAALFVVFHSFETALRSTVAVTLEKHYQHKRWWRKIYDEVANGRPATSVNTIGNTQITRDAAHAIGQIIYGIEGDDLNKGHVRNCQNGYQFTECCQLIHIRRLIENHWFIFSPLFEKNGTRLPRQVFVDKFNLIRDARNDIYHHKSVARMTDAATYAEELLDYLNFSMRFVFDKVSASGLMAPAFKIAIEPRHRPWQ